MSEARADPDELLRRVNAEERRARRGKLVIFFGAAPGVGKTYAMLEAARSERDLKRDVVIGVVEARGRFDTGALVLGLELLPRRKVDHRGVIVEEFDLDAALAFSAIRIRAVDRRCGGERAAPRLPLRASVPELCRIRLPAHRDVRGDRSEEHTSELQ